MSNEAVNVGRVMTVKEVADFLKVSQGFVRDHASGAKKPVLVGVKLGSNKGKGLWRFLESDVHAFLLEHRRGK
jgi:hypothetical protein